MTPYYADDLVTIYHGDCREWMPLSVDTIDAAEPQFVLVTDPPYDRAGDETAAYLVGHMSNAAVFGWPEALVRIAMAAGRVPDDWIVWWPTNAGLRSWGPKGQTPRESEHIAIFGEVRWVHGAPTSANADKLAVTSVPFRDAARGEAAQSPKGRRWGDVWTEPSPGLGFQSHLRRHPNEKPVDIMVRLLGVVADGTVLDPFMGSGSTLEAAKRLGHRAIGIEIEERYCEIAAQRCSQEVLGLVG